MKIIIYFFVFMNMLCQAQGPQWTDVGGGVNGLIEILKYDSVSNKLYAGGQFSQAGGVFANYIACWNGQNWSCIGNNSVFKGIGPYIDAITFLGGDLVVAGRFDSIDNIPVHNIARWDGSAWNAFGSGFDVAGSDLYAIDVFNGELYAGGDFYCTSADTFKNIAKWNGNAWTKIGNGLNNYVTSMRVYHNQLIIGGVFSQAFINDSTAILSPHTVAWDGITWQLFGGNLQDASYNFEIFHDTLYSCGQSSIKYYNGVGWSSISCPTGGNQPWIVDLKVYHDELYACGYFTNPPDLARYNGVNFDSVCEVHGFIEELEEFNGELYAAGGFDNINGNPFHSIARYNPYNSIAEYVDSEYPVISPNPFDRSINTEIHIENKLVNRINIVTLDGRKLIESNRENTDLSILSAGLYIVEIFDRENRKYVLPFIVK